MTRLPGCALQVRGRVTGFFDRTSLSCRKTGRIHAATLRAFLHPPAAPYGDPGGRATSRAARPILLGLSFCRSALVRDQPTERQTHALRSRTSALLQVGRMPGDSRSRPPLSFFCGSAPCARQTYGAIHRSAAVAHRVRSHRQALVADFRLSGPLGQWPIGLSAMFTAPTALSRTPGHPPPC